MEKRKRQCLWFFAPDPKTETNEKLADYLAQESIKAGSPGQIVYQSKPVNGWFVQHRVITIMHKAAQEFNFKFRVFVKEGGGEWRENFLHQKGKVSRKAKKAKAKLKETVQRKTEKR